MARKTIGSIIREIRESDGIIRGHITDRSINREFVFEDPEIKDLFREVLWAAAIFFDIVVYTYAFLDNHYHLNIKVPPPYTDESRPDDAELVWRYGVWYGSERGEALRTQMDQLKKAGLEKELESIRKRLLRRMRDLSSFQQGLNQRFTYLYGKKKEKTGPIFSGRYHLSGYRKQPSALCFISSYIEKNPIRIGLCRDYGVYRWTGFGDAIRGNEEARRGITELVRDAFGWKDISYSEAAEIFNAILVHGYYEVSPNLFDRDLAEALAYVRSLPRYPDSSDMGHIISDIRNLGDIPMRDMLSFTLRALTRAHVFEIVKKMGRDRKRGYYPIGNGMYAKIDHRIRGPDMAKPT